MPVISLANTVAALCTHPHRAVGSPGHAAARAYLLSCFTELGLHAYLPDSFELPYEIHRQHFTNLVGFAPGHDPEAAPVLIGAHYDTVPNTPGADDNAAAVAIVLEVAGRLIARPAARPVLIAHFDAEEPPYFHTTSMGSTRFVADQLQGPVHAALVLDLVGHAVPIPGMEYLVGVMGSESHPQLAEVMASHAARFLPVMTLQNRFMPDMSDHYAFRLAAVPYLFFTCGQWRHYHGPGDRPEELDYPKMVRIADLLEAVVRDVVDAPMTGAENHDSSGSDTDNLQRLLGTQSEQLGLRGPTDFDRVVRQIISTIQWQ